MIMQLICDEPYNEAKLRSMMGAINKAGNTAPIEVLLRFSAIPSMSFRLNGGDGENIIAQANMLETVTKDLAAKWDREAKANTK